MEIKKVTTTKEFDQMTEDWRTLAVWQFGPLHELESENSQALVSVAMVDGEAVAYLIADSNGSDLWHIETRTGHTGKGYARELAQTAGVGMAWEVCSDAGAAFCESLGIDFEDCRE